MPDSDSLLSRLTKGEMVRDRFPGMDALVAFVAEGQKPSAQVQEQLDARGQSRWFPKEGGHVVKMPHRGESIPPGPFEVQPGGWDHEHCDGCKEHIMAGQECWVTTGRQFHVLCDACYEKLR